MNDNKDDGRHIALILEGGGMRGVTTGGMVTAIQELGLRDYLDSIHAASSGAGAAAYLMAGQSEQGTSIYYEDLLGDKFISFKNLLLRRPIMDIDYLVDGVMNNAKHLDFEQIKKSKPMLNIIITDVEKAEMIITTNHTRREEFMKLLKISMSVPFITKGLYDWNGKMVTDGGMVSHIPLESAIRSGATHVIFFGTRKKDELYYPIKTLYQYLQSLFLCIVYGKGMAKLAIEQNGLIQKNLNYLLKGSHKGVQVSYVPLSPDTPKIKRLTLDAELLREGGEVNKKYVKDISLPYIRK